MRMRNPRRLGMLPACLLGLALCAGIAQAAPLSFKVSLTGAEEVPPVKTKATGIAEFTYDAATRKLGWFISYRSLSGPVTMAHLHGSAAKGKNAAPQVWLSMQGRPVESPLRGQATLTPEQAKQFVAGEWYVNLHTQTNPGGEIRGQVLPPKR